MNFDDEFFCGCCESCDSFEESRGESSSELELEECAKPPTLWETILQESDEQMKLYLAWKEENNNEIESEQSPHSSDSVEYLNREIFPVLLPALEQVLIEAKKQNVLKVKNPRSQFNGQDYLAEILWNKNPRHPARSSNYLTTFQIPEFQSWLKSNPRQIFAKSWSEEEAASIIQRSIRSWLAKKVKN